MGLHCMCYINFTLFYKQETIQTAKKLNLVSIYEKSIKNIEDPMESKLSVLNRA